MSFALRLRSGLTARVRFTASADGDFAVGQPSAVLAARRRGLVPLPWTWLRQVHGGDVVRVRAPGACAGAEADAAVTSVVGAALAIQTADCAAIALVAEDGIVAAVHAGWRGLVSGVVDRAAAAMRDAGAGELAALVGPCIHPCCYAFGVADLARLAARYGDGVRAATRDGHPALDVPAAVCAALAGVGAAAVATSGTCTGCGTPAMFSHRVRGDVARQAMVVWLDHGDAGARPAGGPAR